MAKINIKNYTSEVPASTSMANIEKYLAEAGATDISKKYESGVCVAISFRIMVNNLPLFFKLPARVEACFKVLWDEISRPKEGTRERTMQQAERTAWKIVAEWVQIQLTMVQLQQAELLQVFLPYVYDVQKDETFYQKLQGNNFKLLNQ